MNQQQHFSPPELVHAFVDGELDSLQETLLFRTLADDQELRLELRDILAIRSAVHSDREVLTPPEALKPSVFDRAGLQQPVPPAPAIVPAALPQEQEDTSRRRRYAAPIIAAITASLLTTAVLLLTLPEITPDATLLTNAGNGNHTSNNDATNIAANNNDDIPITGSFATDDDIEIFRPDLTTDAARDHGNRRTARTGIYDEQSPPLVATDIPDADWHDPQTPEAQTHTPATRRDMLFSASLQRVEQAAHSITSYSTVPIAGSYLPLDTEPLQFGDGGSSGLSLFASGFVTRSNPQPTIAPGSQPWFIDMSVGISYAISDRHAIGFEVGQEAFAQVFNGTENDSLQVRYEQSPNVLWMGLSYRRDWSELELPGGIRPFTRVFAGGSRLGPVARGIIGLQYAPDDAVLFSFGLEGSSLIYKFQDAWFSTDKIGINYSVSVRL